MKLLTTTSSGGALTLPTFYQTTVTPTLPTRQVSVNFTTSANPNWSRLLQISDQYVFVKGYNGAAVAIGLNDIINLALVIAPELTWTPPIIGTQPVNASCVHSSTAATFTVVAGSEYTLTYQWQYSTNGGSTWSNATGTVSGTAFTNGTTATLTCTPTTTGLTGALIRCTVTDSASTPGSATTSTATLTIT